MLTWLISRRLSIFERNKYDVFIQNIVTLPKYGPDDALNIRRP